MSLGNLLEMEELGHQVVPERDFSKPKPRVKRRDPQPVPKPRGRSSKAKDVDVEKGIVRELSPNLSDGVDNVSFSPDQEESHKKGAFMKTKPRDFLSSDTEHEDVPKGRGYGKREKIVEKVEVYQLGRMDKSDISENDSNASIKSKKKSSKRSKTESKVEILDETRKPKPKKRSNMFEIQNSISNSDNENIDEDEVEKMSRRLKEMKAKTEKDQIENPKDDEYLSITMQNEDEEMEEKDKKPKQGSRFVSKFKNLAKSFLKSSAPTPKTKEEDPGKSGKSRKSKKSKDKSKEKTSQKSDTSIQRDSNEEEECLKEEDKEKLEEKIEKKSKSRKSFEVLSPVKEREKAFKKTDKFKEKETEISKVEPTSASSSSSASSGSSSSDTSSDSSDISSDEESDDSSSSSSGSETKDRMGYENGKSSQLWLSDVQYMSEEDKKKLLGVTIYKVDLLPVDAHMFHPLVRVTLMNQDGSFIPKRKYEKKMKKKKEKMKSSDSSSSESKVSKERVSYILPAMTQPAVPRDNAPLFAPKWSELILFNEKMVRFLTPHSKAILFFEIMDFLPMKRTNFKVKGYHGNENGWYKAAWAFLKLVGKNGILNVDQKLRLQLYKPEKIPKKKIFIPAAPEVFQMWEHGKRIKIVAKSLHITVRGIYAPTTVPHHMKDLLAMRKKHSILLQSQDSRDENAALPRGKSKEERLYPQWNRIGNQNCKVPNKLFRTLPASHIAELNLTVMGNVYSIKFSPCGLKLAAGLDNQDVHVILIFDIPSCELEKNLRAHHGLIYDLDWVEITKENEKEKGFVHYLGSASADSTATIWRVEEIGSPRLIKVLLHPSFVYSIKFHPKKPNLVATGCYDFIIRIWEVQKHGRKGITPDEEISPLLLLDEHLCYVNSLVFTKDSDYLFSGDGSGYLFRWTIRSGKKKPWKMERDIKMSENDIGINSLCLNATGTRLLVHLKGSCIKLLDTESLLLLHTFTGIVNEKFQIKSCFTPCGTLVLSGSEDACLCIWDAETGNLIQRLSPENNPSCMISSVDYHPHDYYLAIGLSSPESEPRPIIIYGFNPSKHKRLAISTIAKMQSWKNKLTKGKENGTEGGKTNSALQFTRGHSSETFGNIVKKLDMALKIARNSKVMKENSLVNQMLEKEKKEKKRSNGQPQFSSLTETKKKSRTQIDIHSENNVEGIERETKVDRSQRRKNWIEENRHSVQLSPPFTENIVKSQSAQDFQEVSRKKRRNEARKKELEGIEVQTNVDVIKHCGDDGSINETQVENKISKSRLKRREKLTME